MLPYKGYTVFAIYLRDYEDDDTNIRFVGGWRSCVHSADSYGDVAYYFENKKDAEYVAEYIKNNTYWQVANVEKVDITAFGRSVYIPDCSGDGAKIDEAYQNPIRCKNINDPNDECDNCS